MKISVLSKDSAIEMLKDGNWWNTFVFDDDQGRYTPWVVEGGDFELVATLRGDLGYRLNPITPAGRAIWRAIRRDLFVERGLPVDLVEQVDRLRYVTSPGVIEAAIKTYAAPAWDNYPGLMKGVNRWYDTAVVAPIRPALRGLSCPRIETVYKIVLLLRAKALKQ